MRKGHHCLSLVNEKCVFENTIERRSVALRSRPMVDRPSVARTVAKVTRRSREDRCAQRAASLAASSGRRRWTSWRAAPGPLVRPRSGAAGPAVGAGQGEQRDVAGAVTVGLEASTIAVEVELEETDVGEVGVELAGDQGLVEGDAGLAPGGADVDDQRRGVAALGLDDLGDPSAAGRGDQAWWSRGSRGRGRCRGRSGRVRGAGEQDGAEDERRTQHGGDANKAAAPRAISTSSAGFGRLPAR